MLIKKNQLQWGNEWASEWCSKMIRRTKKRMTYLIIRGWWRSVQAFEKKGWSPLSSADEVIAKNDCWSPVEIRWELLRFNALYLLLLQLLDYLLFIAGEVAAVDDSVRWRRSRWRRSKWRFEDHLNSNSSDSKKVNTTIWFHSLFLIERCWESWERENMAASKIIDQKKQRYIITIIIIFY